VLLITLWWFIRREINKKDDIWKVVKENQNVNQKALEDTRKSFNGALTDTVERFQLSMDRMDETVKSIGAAISDLNVTVGKSYATRDELNDVKRELKEDFRRDLANCAGRRKPNFCEDGD
jgi:imidazoleglycerol phosphate dehydratase HisB